ncbi:MAG: hypothetical protein ABIG66_00675 [Candidatus Kerfeldbacteria bacterium]
MKHTLLAAVLVAAGLTAGNAASAMIVLQPHEVRIPDGATGITEQTFADIKASLPCGAQPLPACQRPVFAGSDNVYLRVANGAMYQYHGMMEGARYTVRLKRYLPDGVYRHKGNVYLVENGRRIKLAKGKAFARTLRAARTGAAHGMTTDNMNRMIDKSTYCYGAADFEACNNDADAFREQYEGQLVMNADTGALYYVPQGGLPVQVEKFMDSGQGWYAFMKSIAGVQPHWLIKALPSGKALGFVR